MSIHIKKWFLGAGFIGEPPISLRPYHASKNTHLKKEAMHFLWRALDLPGVQHNCPDAAARFLPPTLSISVSTSFCFVSFSIKW